MFLQSLILIALFLIMTLVILSSYNKIVGLPSRNKYYFDKYKADSIVFTSIVLVSLSVTVTLYPFIIKFTYDEEDQKIVNTKNELYQNLLVVENILKNQNSEANDSFLKIKEYIDQQENEINFLQNKINSINIALTSIGNETKKLAIYTQSHQNTSLFDVIYNNVIPFVIGIIGSLFASALYTNITSKHK